jgi:hypothetical protein
MRLTRLTTIASTGRLTKRSVKRMVASLAVGSLAVAEGG